MQFLKTLFSIHILIVSSPAAALEYFDIATRRYSLSSLSFPVVCVCQVNTKIAIQCKEASEFSGCLKSFGAPASF